MDNILRRIFPAEGVNIQGALVHRDGVLAGNLAPILVHQRLRQKDRHRFRVLGQHAYIPGELGGKEVRDERFRLVPERNFFGRDPVTERGFPLRVGIDVAATVVPVQVLVFLAVVGRLFVAEIHQVAVPHPKAFDLAPAVVFPAHGHTVVAAQEGRNRILLRQKAEIKIGGPVLRRVGIGREGHGFRRIRFR